MNKCVIEVAYKEFYHFICLKMGYHRRNSGQNTRLITGRHFIRLRCYGEKVAVRGRIAVFFNIEDTHLPLIVIQRSIHQGLASDSTSIREQVAHTEVICAINHHIIIGYSAKYIVGSQGVRVSVQYRLRVARSQTRYSGIGFKHPYASLVKKKLAVQVVGFYFVKIN